MGVQLTSGREMDSDHNARRAAASPPSVAPLIVRFAAFGDIVLLATLIEVLYRRYGRTVDLLSSGAWTRPLLAADPRVNHIQLITSRKSPYPLRPSQWQAVRWLRRRGLGAVYLCDPEPKAQWLVDHAGIGREWVVRAHDHPAATLVHWTDWWLAIGQLTPQALVGRVAPLEARGADTVPRLYVSNEARADCTKWLAAHGWVGAPLVLLQPGNKRTLKRGRLATLNDAKHWPAERWGEVVQGVLRMEPRAQVLLCGAPAEAGVLDAICQAAQGTAATRGATAEQRVHNLAHELPVPRLLALLERAHSMISVDTGPAHAAAALDCPLTVLFASQDQRLWRPRSPAGRVASLGGWAGAASRLTDISAGEVLSAWQALGGAGGLASVRPGFPA